MGRLADLVEEIEDGLTEATEALKDQDRQIEELQDTIEELTQTTKEQAAYIAWVESYYPEAERQYKALQKVRG